MRKLTREEHPTDTLPIKVLQFGEGNFLRAFVDWMIDSLNKKANYNSGVAIIQPLTQGMTDMLAAQDGLYHHLLQGIENGKTVDEANLIECVQEAINPFKDIERYFRLAELESLELVFSNTTEAGIVFDDQDLPKDGALASTFPGKLTQFLKHRYDHFSGSEGSGLSIVPCELIADNGTNLKKAILQYIDLWSLGDGFKNWTENYNFFANTLVDRIVPGYPGEEIDDIKERIGFDDQLVVKSETFHLFVIQGPVQISKAFPADKHGLNVKYVSDINPYRTQKVRILNGAHTSMVPVGVLAELETVQETVEHDVVGQFVRNTIFEEIVPLINIPGEDPKIFAEQVITRFRNPFIRHELMSISLNSISKYKVRVLPSVLDHFTKNGQLPKRMLFSLACLIKFYVTDEFEKKDDVENLKFFFDMAQTNFSSSELVGNVLRNEKFWGQDLTKIDGLSELVAGYYEELVNGNIIDILKNL